MPRDLTKSRYLDGLRCPKLLWTRWNRPERIPPPEPQRELIMQAGRQVGALAQRLFPGGVEVPRFDAAHAAVRATAKLLEQRVPLFEAAFAGGDRLCRVDVLVPGLAGRWDIVEVKAGTRVRESHVRDVAFQYDTLTRAGLEIDRMVIMHLDGSYVRGDEVDLEQLFSATDVTERVMHLAPYMGQTIGAMQDMLTGPDPDTPLGSRCNAPHPCPLKPDCWGDLPPANVTQLYAGGRKIWEFMNEGLFTLAGIADARLTPRQRIQKHALVNDEVHLEKPAVQAWVDQLEYPLYHLDFETFAPAVPAFPGAHPYQQIPCQFSLHIQQEPGAEPDHREFLATEPGDPRPQLVEALLAACGEKGTILAWNMSFEKLVIEDLATYDLVRAPRLLNLATRLADLMAPFQSFAVYHPGQGGSCSLKVVLPAVTELDYSELNISSGGTATHSYEQAMFGGLDPARREVIFNDLRAYCCLDTLAMVEILRWLEGAIAN
ncbi:MAG: DUF2779 domain-containing protein [bacterium]|nr:DUF2779 domain-containing protein [bacterium]